MKRLLFIAHRVPYPPDKGDRLRAFHEIKALAQHCDVTLATLADSPASAVQVQNLKPWCRNILIAPSGGLWRTLRGAGQLLVRGSVTASYFWSRSLARRIRAAHEREPFDVVVGACSSTLAYVLGVPARRRILDLVDLDSLKWRDYANHSCWPWRWLYQRESRAVETMEQCAVTACDAVVCASPAETTAYSWAIGRITAVGNGVDLDYFSLPEGPRPEREMKIVFTGQMDYRPNVEGVCWFVQRVWPLVRRQQSRMQFLIVGRNPTASVRRLERVPGVIVTGAVADVRPYLASASVAVAPLLIARGIQNKVLEAMAMECPVVVSPAVASGLESVAGKFIIEAQTPQQWAQSILQLAGDSRRRLQMALGGRNHLEATCRWSSQLKPLLNACKLPGRETSPLAAAAGDTRTT